MPESKPKPVGVPNWLPWAATIAALAGLADSIYLTIAHYTTPKLLACPHVSILNCGKVTTSVYSSILGVPLAVLGLLFFVAVVPLQLPQVWRIKYPLVIWGRLAMAGSGILMIFWLVYVELFKLNAICVYCTAVHIITLILFGLTVFGTALIEET